MSTQTTSIEALTLSPARTGVVEALIRSQGERGATDWEIHEALSCPYSSVQRPRGDLVASGAIRDSGLRRRTGYGRNAIVWIAG